MILFLFNYFVISFMKPDSREASLITYFPKSHLSHQSPLFTFTSRKISSWIRTFRERRIRGTKQRTRRESRAKRKETNSSAKRFLFIYKNHKLKYTYYIYYRRSKRVLAAAMASSIFPRFTFESSVRASARSCRKLLNSAHYFLLYR